METAALHRRALQPQLPAARGAVRSSGHAASLSRIGVGTDACAVALCGLSDGTTVPKLLSSWIRMSSLARVVGRGSHVSLSACRRARPFSPAAIARRYCAEGYPRRYAF